MPVALIVLVLAAGWRIAARSGDCVRRPCLYTYNFAVSVTLGSTALLASGLLMSAPSSQHVTPAQVAAARGAIDALIAEGITPRRLPEELRGFGVLSAPGDRTPQRPAALIDLATPFALLVPPPLGEALEAIDGPVFKLIAHGIVKAAMAKKARG